MVSDRNWHIYLYGYLIRSIIWLQVDKRNDTAAFGSGTPKKPVSISEKEQKIPNFIGGPGFLRDDNITPEVSIF